MAHIAVRKATTLEFLEVKGENPWLPFEEAQFIQERATREVMLPSEQRGFDIQPLGFHEVFDHLMLVERERSDWVVMPVNLDPLYQSRFPVPREILGRLETVSQAGIDFDLLYAAHEIPKGSLLNGSATELKSVLTPPSLFEAEALSEELGHSALSFLKGASLIAGGIVVTSLICSGVVLTHSMKEASRMKKEAEERRREERHQAERREREMRSPRFREPLPAASEHVAGERAVVRHDLRHYDPMLFGVITKDKTPKREDWGYFFLLAAWRW